MRRWPKSGSWQLRSREAPRSKGSEHLLSGMVECGVRMYATTSYVQRKEGQVPAVHYLCWLLCASVPVWRHIPRRLSAVIVEMAQSVDDTRDDRLPALPWTR
jgi:hypothetical protein